MDLNQPITLEALAALLPEEFVWQIEHGKQDIADQLFIKLDEDDQERVLPLQVMLLPGVEENLPLIQFFVKLPYLLTARNEANLCRFICALNPNLAITGFEYSEAQELLFFRFNTCSSKLHVDNGAFKWIVTVIEYQIMQFGGLVEAVAGGMHFDEARTLLIQELLKMHEQE